MKANFTQPQRQSILGIFVMFLYALKQYIRAIWPLFVIWILKFNEINKVYFFAAILCFIIIVSFISYLKYLNFTFYINQENDEFIITEGVFNKTKTTIQLNKIQQVNVNQSLIQRLFGVYELTADTAGSSKKEVHIKAIAHDLALDLKAQLLLNESKIVVGNSVSDELDGNRNQEFAKTEIPFLKISFLSLLKIGITRNYLKSFLIILAFLLTILDYFKRFTGRDVLELENVENYVNTSQVLRLSLLLCVVFFLSIIIVNLVKTIFTYFDYSIAKQNGSLLLSFGLLNTKSTILKPEKVQIASITQNFFQKKMNVLGLKITQATGGETKEHQSAIEIPGCNTVERDAILKLLFQKIPEKGVQLKPNFRKLGFSIFLSIGLPVLAYYFLRDFLLEKMETADYVLGFLVLFVGMIQYFLFKNNRLFIKDDFIIHQSGAWDITNKIIVVSKIQAITTSQLFWHQNSNIGSLTLHTAGGRLSFQLGNFTAIKQFTNLWLYKMETSDSNWM